LDIDGWLRRIGLPQYAEMFRANDIDIELLGRLTNDDLKDIGVVSFGHRKKLLEAIAELAGAFPVSPQLAIEPKARDTAERRQVTVMFADLVGSTALSARMDPEDLREVISAYQKYVADTVDRFGGFVAKYMGDGVLVYFGYPQAHEDDAERAVRAGLDLVAAVSGLKTNASLQTRVGIATGLVVVGDLIGSGASQEQAIVGETPNLAARLQGIAEPNIVVIAEGTRKLLGNLFELEDLGAQDLKGITGPVRAWAALWASSVESRFEALHASGLTALVGREEETELLLRRWSRTKSGEGQLVLLSGEPGIGKSRLTAALLESLAHEPHTRLRYFCSPQHTDSAFYPIIGQMERAAGLAHEDNSTTKFDKLDVLLAQTSTSIEDTVLLAEMLSLSNDGRCPSLDKLTPEQRRERTLQVLVSQTKALARKNPVLMIFEDAHWADPTSLEVFSRLVERIVTLRVLLIVTFRPEFEPPWIGRPHVTALTLNRLTQRQIGVMIDRVVGNKLLPTSVRHDITERSDGIPLFIEEMTKAVLEAESQGAAEQTVAAIPSATRAVPASLHASLMARLDRLGAAKEVAQIGAALGREFSHALLSAVVRKPDAELGSVLDRLIASGLLFRQGVPHATYLFKHALVQDAAYGTLLREPRRTLHARIADTLESRFAEIAENQPELLARHCTEAGLIEKAAGFWGKAGQRSLARSALVEAVEQLAQALDQIAMLPSTPTLRREQIKLQVALTTPLLHVKGYAAPETKAAQERARLLIEQAEAKGEAPEDPLLLFSVLFGLWVANLTAFNGDVLRELAEEFLALAKKQGTIVPLIVGHNCVGTSLAFTGAFAAAQAHYNQAIALYDPAAHRAEAMRFGQDVGVTTLTRRSLTLWALGYPDAATAGNAQALRYAREIGQAATSMYVLGVISQTSLYCGDYAVATALIDELVSLADEKSSLFWRAHAMLIRGCLWASTGQATEAVQSVTSGFSAYRSTGSTLWGPYYLSYLACAYAELGSFEEAQRSNREAITTVERTKERWCEADVQRIAGEIALMSPKRDAAKAEGYFERALTVSRQQKAKSWELRAAMSMARLWRDQGKPQEARDILAPVYGWFTEGFDTRDLKEAKALFDELHA
jgi:class 3 adenylate cyclase/predicted ATPase